MSKSINNREYRQQMLKEVIGELHQGASVEEVKERFSTIIEGVSATEISQMEQALINEGLAISEVQRLCDVHASVFKGSIEDIHKPTVAEETPGHPVHTFRSENTAIEKLINEQILPNIKAYKESQDQENVQSLLGDFTQLQTINNHYARKENLLFPYLEQYGITGPPKVMWGVDDEIRDEIKVALKNLNDIDNAKRNWLKDAESVVNRVSEMIYKEENILWPMALDSLDEDEWLKIEESSDEMGYTLVQPAGKWQPVRTNFEQNVATDGNNTPLDSVKFDAGILTPDEINSIFNTLPIDITFVDKDGAVKYFSQGKERIFPRPKTIIGRQVNNCHPPASVHIVEKLVEDLKSDIKDHEDFWLMVGEKYVYIRYYAVRNAAGEYLGVVEVSQDIKPIQEIEGEKRLVEG